MKNPNIYYSVIFTVLLTAAAWAQDEPAKQPEQKAFKSALAIKAKTDYDAAVAAVNNRFVQELDVALKRAMQVNQLEEANTINEAKKQIAEKKELDVTFTTSPTQSSEGRYRQGIESAQRVYVRALDFAQQRAMSTSDLEEANTIKAVRDAITESMTGMVGGQSLEDGLRLMVSGKQPEVWKNEAVSLPGTPAKITFSGTLELPAKVTRLKLRSAAQFGSDRLTFTCGGKELELIHEPNAPRYVVYEPKLNTSRVKLVIDNSIAANSWLWGPLQWSINDGGWRDIPVRNMSPK